MKTRSRSPLGGIITAMIVSALFLVAWVCSTHFNLSAHFILVAWLITAYVGLLVSNG